MDNNKIIMKTYKHKTNGTIATYKDGVFKQGNTCVEIGCEPSSEFWEEVISKDYEILSFGNKENNLLYTLHNDRYRIQSIDGFSVIGDRDLHYCLRYYKIISIKRLSDGEVFTVGDKIKTSYRYESTIENINIDKFCRFYINHNDNSYNNFYNLHDLLKIKQPLFTTEDGVELFYGESVYGVTDNFQLCYTSIATEENIQRCKVFAKKENAEKYIFDNEKRYSLNDIRQALNYYRPQTPTGYTNIGEFLRRLENGK